MQIEFIEVGVVKALYRYPVKSMRGESLAQAHVYWHGLDGDRRYAFVRSDNRSSFPWLTGREVPQLLRYLPTFDDPGDVINSPVYVRTPAGRTLPLESAELRTELAKAYGRDVSLIKIGRGVYDSQVLSLMSLATVRDLSRQAGIEIDGGRFRQNIIVETFADRPYQEESWLDGQLVFGAQPDPARIRLNRRIVRCVMVNINPETAEKDRRVLKTVAQSRDSCAGVYGSTEKPGTISVGDVVRVMRDA